MPTYNHDDNIKKKKQDAGDLATFLYDATMRRQIYLEGLKLWYVKRFSATADDINQIVARQLSKNKKNVGTLTKAELLGLLAIIRKDVTKLMVGWRNGFTSDLQKFLAVDAELAHAIFDVPAPKGQNAKDANANLWATIRNAFVPAAGVSLVVMLTYFINQAVGKVTAAISTAYADGMTNADAQILVRDAVNKIVNGGRGTIETAMQHVGSMTQADIASKSYGKYIWTSVIDSRTTVICQSRNMKIYEYGLGPLPPAHYGCRSSIVPIVDGVAHEKQTYYTWLRSQPDEVQDDLLGRKRARDLRSGELKASDLDRFDGANEITLEQYSGKAGFILRNRNNDNGAQA